MDGFDPLVFGGAEGLRLTWQGQGLQPDDLAAHNAVAILHAVQTPLIIDPSSQAMVWLQATLSAQQGHACEVVAQHDAHLVTSLELAVRFGTTLIVSEVDAVHPLLHPLLRGETEKQGGRLVVHVGDRFVDQHPGFRLYLTTRNAAPALTPEVAPLLAVANFTVTRAGLEGEFFCVVSCIMQLLILPPLSLCRRRRCCCFTPAGIFDASLVHFVCCRHAPEPDAPA